MRYIWIYFSIVCSKFNLGEKAIMSNKTERNKIIELLAEDGIGTSVHYKPLHQMSYYREKYNLIPDDYPVTEKIWKGCFSLPIYSLMTTDEVNYVVDRLLYHLRSDYV
jgi:dTDP-4-amino-4,6-dideoxygalactose transaminase